MKTNRTTRLAAFCLLAASQLACAGKAVAVREDGETPITLRGTVIGPISSGSKADGTFFKAYHLKLGRAMTFDDGADCSEQSKASLALNQEDMGRYKGKIITVKAKVFCQTNRTGTYHLSGIVVQ
ncbi:hypothetical protein [Chromobacterium sphagni]|uniref:Lipoprotein n=1 Tax=Chromobacterium sphagni TaxID=1903179 RepID=A0A1S1WXU4_9NEIS|nr:hypothetical protein [Chromobacterium sphagni]OHX12117.1 hypothetical protein BI347_00370 [Chromobacterium sphagni]OHX21799.1 hypothetical protein BI344_04645 [Chromobacterium sphagni]